MRNMVLAILFSTAAFWYQPAHAQGPPDIRVFVADSPSYVKQAVLAAHELLERHPRLKFDIRTTEQILAEEPEAIKTLVREADVLVFGRVYGDVTQRLLSALRATELSGKTIFAVYSDTEVLRFNRYKQRALLENLPLPVLKEISDSLGRGDPADVLRGWEKRYPDLAPWTKAVAYVASKGANNFRNLFLHLISGIDNSFKPEPVEPIPAYFLYSAGQIHTNFDRFAESVDLKKPVVALIDHDSYFHSGDRRLLEVLVADLSSAGFTPMPIIASWGEPTYRALKEFLLDERERFRLAGIVSLQSFVLGGDQAREKVSPLIRDLGVPVFRAIRLPKRSPEQWKTSEDGLPWSSVYYQVAMPELQGMIEPILVGAEKENVLEPRTGARISTFEPIPERISKLVRRIHRWQRLQSLRSEEKRIAIIYYNHPPGKQNIGADYLNVPATMLHLLDNLKTAGYGTGEYPRDPDAFLALLLERGINVANWAQGLQAELARHAFLLPQIEYRRWFETLPAIARAEVREGPFGYIRELVEVARELDDRSEIAKTIDRFIEEVKGFISSFPGDKSDAYKTVDTLKERLTDRLQGGSAEEIEPLMQQIQKLYLEGVSGWGPAPGQILVTPARHNIVIPGLRVGNVFLGPQPQRGWQADADTLHSSTIIPPHHQYLAFYYFIHHVFKADAIIHVGRHSSYEWLPRKQVALADFDFPDIVIGDAPAFYLYTVDGVGEGLQAKRRGLSVIVDHMIPPLKATELYGALLEFQQLVEQYEAQDVPQRKEVIARAIRDKIRKHHFTSDLSEGILSYDDAKLIHTMGHYLEELKTTFLPYGLHTFGKPWEPEKVEVLADSMSRMNPDKSDRKKQEFSALIRDSFTDEIQSLLAGLEGRYIRPGKGNDPIRTSEVLPTGRNFFAIDASVMPTQVSFQLGRRLVDEALKLRTPHPEKIAAILWAVETVRDEGTMLSFILHLLGVRPEWDVRGMVKDLRAVPLEKLGHPRIDVVVTTSGLFRDLFGQLLMVLDKAYRVALAASYHSIVSEQPQLAGTLKQALENLEDYRRYLGRDPISRNFVAKHWIEQMKRNPSMSGELALARIFGPAEGAYGAGINRVIEQAWTWKQRTEVTDVYLTRMNHVYTAGQWGVSQPVLYRQALKDIALSFHSRATNLYGVVDNDDYFDYFGGLSMAIEKVNRKVPGNYILSYADPEKSKIETLEHFLTREMRSRYYNPEWIEGMMKEGYSGARTVSNKFAEFAWGWQVTNPDIIRNWMWNELADVYLKDKYQIGVTKWLSGKQNSAALVNISAILLTAAEKGFWKADPALLRSISNQMAELVSQYGPACSAHSCGNQATIEYSRRWMRTDLRTRFDAAMDSALLGLDGHSAVSGSHRHYGPQASRRATESRGRAPARLGKDPGGILPDLSNVATILYLPRYIRSDTPWGLLAVFASLYALGVSGAMVRRRRIRRSARVSSLFLTAPDR